MSANPKWAVPPQIDTGPTKRTGRAVALSSYRSSSSKPGFAGEKKTRTETGESERLSCIGPASTSPLVPRLAFRTLRNPTDSRTTFELNESQ